MGFHQISLRTFIRNCALCCNNKKNENSKSSRSFQSRTLKNKKVIASSISVIRKPKPNSYDNLFKDIVSTN